MRLHKGDGKKKDRIDSGDLAKSTFDHCLDVGTEGQVESPKIPTSLIRVSENVSDVMKRNRKVRRGVPSEKMTESVLELFSWRPAGCWTHGTGWSQKKGHGQ